MAYNVHMGTLTPELVRGLMAAHGIPTLQELAKRAGISHSILYKFDSGKMASLGLSTRQRLAVVFPGSERLLVADIIGAVPAEASEAAS